MWPLFLPLVLIVLLYYGLRYYFTRNFNYWKKRNVVGPEPIPLFGNTKDLNLRRTHMTLVYQDIYDKFPNEKVVGFFRMTSPTLLIRDLDIIKHIMIKDFGNFSDRGIQFSTEGLGKNLFHIDGDYWRGLRNRLTPVFTSGKLKNMYNLLDERADKFTEYVYDQCEKCSEVEVHGLAKKYTISTIAACAFGVDLNTIRDNLDTLMDVEKQTLTLNRFYELDMMYPGLLKTLNLSLFPKKVQIFFADLVTKISSERNYKPSSRNDFMDLLLELRETGNVNYTYKDGSVQKELEMTDDVIAAQAFVFYVAGFETSATTVAYLLHEIAKQPQIQEKLIQEIDAVLEANNGKIPYEYLNEKSYLDKVFNETLRMHPIVDPLQRVALANYQIPGTDVVIKKGQLVQISVRGIHYDSKYYPNPELFDPERFTSEETGTRHSCAYLPFGVGPRNCIGMRFGKVQSRLCVAKLLSKFRVEITAMTELNLNIEKTRTIVGPDSGIHLNIVPRSEKSTHTM